MGSKFIILSALAALLTLAAPVRAATRTAPLIIDHTAVAQFNSLTDSQIQAASEKRLLLRHASVGSRIGATIAVTGTTNLSGLEDIKQLYGTKYNRDRWNFWSRGNPAWTTKVSDLPIQVAAYTSAYDIFSMKFCYIDYMADWVTYRDMMGNLENNPAYANKIFVWWTIPIKSIPLSPITEQQQRHAFNEQVRAWVRSHNRVLFDIADIEAYDYDVNPPAAVLYQGLPSYPQKYASDGGHPNTGEPRRILAKAWWVLIAQLAAPSSSSTPTPRPSSTPIYQKPGDANGDNIVDGVDYMVWRNHYNQSVSGAANGDFNNSGLVDGIDYMVWRNNYGK